MSTLVNAETGEVLGRDASSVVQFLENAKWMLDAAVEMTGPAEVALLKAQVVMAETYARELALSKDIQEQSREMVRRAEYALVRAIRQGQERDEIESLAEMRSRAGKNQMADSEVIAKPKPTDFEPGLYANGSQLLQMADGVSPEEFDKALEEAKAEGNLSRANVVRKVKGQADRSPLSRDQKADIIRDLSERGYSSHQMAEKVGVTAARVREIARAFDIDIPADRAVGRGGNQIDHTAAVDSAVTRLEHMTASLNFIDFAEVDGSEADEWVASLTNSLAELRRFINKIKETTHV